MACWQSWKDGEDVLNPHQINMRQRGDNIEIIAVTRGTPLEGGGYLWRGEMKVWDNEILMTGRWVGLSYDGPIISGGGAPSPAPRTRWSP